MPRERRVGSTPTSPTKWREWRDAILGARLDPLPRSDRVALTLGCSPTDVSGAGLTELLEDVGPTDSLSGQAWRLNRAAAPAPSPRYASPAMNVTATPAPKSSIIVEVEVPAEKLDRAVGEADPGPLEADPRPRLPARQGAARRPRGRPRPRRRPRRGRRPPRPVGLPRRAHRAGDPAPHERRRRDRPGRGGQAAHLQGDGPGPARGRARRLPELQLQARDRGRSTTTKVDKVIEEMRDQSATLAPVEDRGAQNGDYAVIKYEGTPRRRAVRRRLGRADAADHRRGPPDPGLRGQPRRARGRRDEGLRHHVPRRLRARSRSPARRPTSRSSCASSARRSCPTSTTTSSSRWATSRTWPSCGARSRSASSGTPSTGPATGSPTGSSTTPSPTRRSTCPTS